MAFVVRRPAGTFEIRESVHTSAGPRARSLASFRRLSDEVLRRAAGRALRPFDAAAVVASARRAGASLDLATDVRGAGSPEPGPAYRRFVESSRRMAGKLDLAPAGPRRDPGVALVELLGFADQVRASQPPRPRQPLGFPVLARLVASVRAEPPVR